MKRKTVSKKRPNSTHLPRGGLYALVDDWRTEGKPESWPKNEPAQQEAIVRHIHEHHARVRCADELERAIARLPVDRQHLEAMVGFEHRSADTIQRLEEFAGELKNRLDTFLSTINTVMVVFRKIEQSERTARDKERQSA